MRIKVFKAPTMKDVMAQVKEELGRDAVILHTKKYKEGGFMGYGSKEVIEVTAAIEDAPTRKPTRLPPPPPATPQDMPPAQPAVPMNVLNQYKTNGTEQGVKLAEDNAALIQPPSFKTLAPPVVDKDTLAASEDTPYQPPPDNPPPTDEAPAVGEDLPMMADDLPTAPDETAEYVAEGNDSGNDDDFAQEDLVEDDDMATGNDADLAKIQKLETELAQLKTMLAHVMGKEQEGQTITLQEALRRQEVADDILDDMAANVSAGGTLVDSFAPEAKDILGGYLSQVVNCSDGIALNKHGTRIAALIGATGVGKTTTLAKIAARFVLDKGISAALITADTYRISAVEQLKTYSDIIGLPLEIVYTPKELKKAIRKYRDKDLILIDTAGRSQHNEFQMNELQEFLRAVPRIEKHLVLSATTKNRDAADILDKFSVCKPDRIIFTKTDETSSVGLILNLLYKKDIALSYLTNGQSVPDDIVPAKPGKLAELLLRE